MGAASSLEIVICIAAQGVTKIRVEPGTANFDLYMYMGCLPARSFCFVGFFFLFLTVSFVYSSLGTRTSGGTWYSGVFPPLLPRGGHIG